MKFVKIIIVVLLFVGVNNFSYSQKNKKEEIKAPEMPISNETNLITYTEVVNLAGTPAEIKKKALEWFHSYYTNSSNLLKKNTEDSFTGHPRFRVKNQKDKRGIATTAGTVIYDITLLFKDGKYKYEITNIFVKKASKFPIEKWMDKESKMYHNGYDYYLLQTNDYMKEVIVSLKKHMASTTKKKDSDW